MVLAKTLALLSVGGMVLVGCGGDGKTSETPAGDSSATTDSSAAPATDTSTPAADSATPAASDSAAPK